VYGDEPGGPIRWRIHIPVEPDRVYHAIDGSAGRASFWAESAPEEDGAVVFTFVDGSTHRAEIVGRVPPKVWAVYYIGGVARFELAPDGRGGTDLRNHDPSRTWMQGYPDQ
jgi:hypothetical protein